MPASGPRGVGWGGCLPLVKGGDLYPSRQWGRVLPCEQNDRHVAGVLKAHIAFCIIVRLVVAINGQLRESLMNYLMYLIVLHHTPEVDGYLTQTTAFFLKLKSAMNNFLQSKYIEHY